jgi:hypothetical protein
MTPPSALVSIFSTDPVAPVPEGLVVVIVTVVTLPEVLVQVTVSVPPLQLCTHPAPPSPAPPSGGTVDMIVVRPPGQVSALPDAALYMVV